MVTDVGCLMKITVNYFGQLKQIAEKDADSGDYPEEMGLGDVLADLASRYDGKFKNIVLNDAGALRPALLVSVNDKAVDKGAPPVLHDGDQINLLPPIAGG